ncbi:TonB-dependent receptor [Sphingomonas crusticola]|uniref:TonB-dependent receptor n=1 Tax=Sphingomonas crusticola TaxID=1697973 RepID=UPI000E2541BF|nr:carboxypeptidase regulatory-like domain-containing protein [Sphingomonas crusticola]
MKKLLAGCALAALATSAVHAQETTSSIRGNVTAQGAPVANATVTILHVPSGTRAVTTTDAAGQFQASGLRAGGPYSVTVTASGYPSYQVTDVETIAAQAFELSVELAGSEQEVVITATRLPSARSVSQGPATVLNTRDIQNIATINRDIRDLARRDPFARLDDTPSGGRAISFAGQNARYNKFSVDGVPITDNFGLNTDGLPSRRSPIPLDAIGQFQAKVAPFDVREGNFQGGAINIVLRSGTNDFQGTGFYSFSSDELTGKKTKDLKVTLPNFTFKNYGAEVSGPIIKDKLFFMVAAERVRAGTPIAEGPTDNNAGTAIPGLTQAQVDQISAIAKSKYNYDTGGILNNSNDRDDRLVAKIDANLSETQRLSLTYNYTKDQINLGQNTFTTAPPGLGLESNGYIQGNRLHTGVAQLNSQWTDEFSTEVRGFYKDYKRLQDPILGRGFAQFRVCDAPTSDRFTATNQTASTEATNCATGNAIVSFGPDISRQTNALTSKTWGGTVQARLTTGNHDIRAFVDYTTTKIFNSFLQYSAGYYYFDSIADFQAGNSQRLQYGNAVPSLNPDDAAAKFGYQQYTFGMMDTWRISDILNVSYGWRYDLYGGHSEAALNRSFVAKYGFNNNEFINGRGVFQPRFGFDFKPSHRFSVRGGAGIFAGGTPDVYVSNSFSNTGVLTNQVTITQNNNGTYGGTAGALPAGTGAAALTNVTGTSIPTAVNNYLASGTVSATSTTNALAHNFKIPSQLRATLSAAYQLDLGGLGDNWEIGGDLFYSDVRNQVYFTDLRSVPIAGSLTPDGRQRYRNITGNNADTGTDILLTNTKKGRSYIAVAHVQKDWDFGLGAYFSFAYADVKDQAPATSSTAGSNYTNGAFYDGNNVSYGISNDQVKYNIKYNLTYDHAFFGDYKTTFALFGETRIGHPYSYTMFDRATGRGAVFGTTGTGSRFLLYVPTVGGDTKVSYDSAATQQAVEALISGSKLKKYQGTVAPRNAFNSKWFTKFDLHLAQQIPTGFMHSRLEAFADIENVTNLINKKWGQIREYTFPYNIALVNVQCLTTPVATGTAPSAAQQVTSTAQTCAQYRYSPAQTSNGQFVVPTDTVYTRQSLYAIRVGLRFSF